jgi:spermidine/putrescine transport system permease protein
VARRVDPTETMPVSRWSRQTRWALLGWATLILFFLYLPIFFLVLFSFEVSQTPGLPITGLTLNWYAVMLGDKSIHTAVLNSVMVAVIVAVIATTLGTMTAFVIVRGGYRWAGTARLAFTLPMMIPGVLLGIGLLLTFRRVADLNMSLATVIAGHLVFTTPFVVLIVAARLQGFDRRLEWAAADLGADNRSTLRHIVLPLIFPAIMAGFLMSITLSIDEFVITYFTVGSQMTLPIFIYTQIKFGVTPEVNALATVILVVTILGFALGSIALAGGRSAFRRGGARRATPVPGAPEQPSIT